MSPGYDGFKPILLGLDNDGITRVQPVEHTSEGSRHTKPDVLEILLDFSKEHVERSIANVGADRQALVVGLWVSFIVLFMEGGVGGQIDCIVTASRGLRRVTLIIRATSRALRGIMPPLSVQG
jgi:hypothetical protein